MKSNDELSPQDVIKCPLRSSSNDSAFARLTLRRKVIGDAMNLEDDEDMKRLLREIQLSEMLGPADLFTGDGIYLGQAQGLTLNVTAPSDPEWPEVVLEDILDAEYVEE